MSLCMWARFEFWHTVVPLCTWLPRITQHEKRELFPFYQAVGMFWSWNSIFNRDSPIIMSFPSTCIFPSTPFALKHVEALDIETLLSSQGSRIVNVEKSSIRCSFLIPSGIPTWSTSTDLEWGFSVHEHRFPNLMLMAVVLFGSVKLTINELSSYIFYLSILWTSLGMCV
jgi:hypothetical protein